ncbi:MAG: phosphatidylserine decarboxylase [Helicobacteraceae bacterium]|jgi:phosphatidylserine decarboxylase|nr:phosphatidylserine decarboxylase [Helicobacteraceae bacterium]
MLIDADFLAFLSFLLVLVTLWIYRNPERTVPYLEKNSIVSIADGTIKSIETLEVDKGIDRYKIVIKTGFLDTAILRVPFACEVQSTELVHGARLSSYTPLANKLNEQSHIVFGQDDKEISVTHTMHLASVGIKNRLKTKAPVVQGMRYGLMVKGETTVVLPANSRIAVKVGDTVRAGETLLGFFS